MLISCAPRSNALAPMVVQKLRPGLGRPFGPERCQRLTRCLGFKGIACLEYHRHDTVSGAIQEARALPPRAPIPSCEQEPQSDSSPTRRAYIGSLSLP